MPATSGAWQIVHFHVDTPSKPAFGAPCNGCGVCCLAEPCPVGILLSGRRTGTCVALRWSEQEARYRCGAVTEPASVLPPLLRRIAPLFSRLARRWIAAGNGCDSSVEAKAPLTPPPWPARS